MNPEDERDREIQALRDRLSRLSEASLRINESLDWDTVLQGVLDSARALTEARYGVMTLYDEAGTLQDFLTSGLPAEKAERLLDVSEGSLLSKHLKAAPGPVRVPDFDAHMRSIGIHNLRTPEPLSAFLVVPILHQGVKVGNLHVAKSESGEEFSQEDEDVLLMFASQAALVIANIRTYREEKRARNDLETLISTTPVGVVVFNVKTGAPLSFNREMERIIADLRVPDSPVEEFLQILTIRRADGREIRLDEFSMAQPLITAETVRAEEIALEMPDGRSINALMNCTPIRSEGGEVETLVVTLQDMSALQELERLRAEFLAMVSHELRTPLAAVKGSVTNLLDPTATLNSAESRQFFQIIDAQTDRMRSLISDLLDVARIETGTLSVAPEPRDLETLTTEASNVFRLAGHRQTIAIDTLSRTAGPRSFQQIDQVASEAEAVGTPPIRYQRDIAHTSCIVRPAPLALSLSAYSRLGAIFPDRQDRPIRTEFLQPGHCYP